MKTEDPFEAVCVDKLSLSFTCRTCLNTDSDQQLVSIFEDTESSGKLLVDLFNKLSLLKLKIAKDDGYPANICSICMERLLAVDAFRKQCEKAQEYLEHYFVKLPENVPDIKPDLRVCCVKDSEILNDSKNIEPPEDGENDNRNDVGFESEESSSEYKPEGEESSLEDEENPLKDNDKLKCPVCDKIFRTVAIKNNHLHLHNKVNAFPCDECEMSFKSRGYLRKHKNMVHPVGHGNKTFIQYAHRKNHELAEKPSSYLCNICGKSFRYECTLKTHLKRHEETLKYPCDICNKQFAQKGNLKLHLAIHNNIRAYQCEQCGKKFTQLGQLKSHMILHNAEKSHHCEFCSESFLRIRDLRRHNLIVHGKTDVSIRFDQSLPENEDTVEMVPMKMEEKLSKKINDFPYACDLCSRTFKVPSSLAKHIKVHSEERKFDCTKCGNTFKALAHLKNHINAVHLKRKPYSCEVCKKSFARVGDRNVHMRAHTDEKPHQCSFCGRGFNLAKALRAHVRQHTGERPFVCIICNAGFTCHKTLASHTRRLHAEDPQVLRKVDELAQTVLFAPSSAAVGDGASTTVTKSEDS